jgi:hypothetical protein
MSETIVNYTVPPTHNVKRCLRCGSDLEWMCDGSLGHVGRKAPQSDWVVCLERQLVNVKSQAEELRKRANQEAEYFAAAMAFIEDSGLELNSATLISYVHTVRARNEGH